MEGGRVGVGEDDTGEGMQCIDHPYRNNPGGICAFCLQEKLGKLVSSSFPLPIRPPSSSDDSPSFPSDIAPLPPTSAAPPPANNAPRTSRLPFLLSKKNNSKPSSAILKRSKSTATPRRAHSFADDDAAPADFSPRKRNGFWSFLYLSSSSSSSSNKPSAKKLNSKSFRDADGNGTPRISAINAAAASGAGKEKCCSVSSLGRKSGIVVVEQDDSPNSNATASASSFDRKVSRSRSVGCGSRSFSGDFFERISTGFGDCTLRRVESQREGKHKASSSAAASSAGGGGAAVNHHHHHHHCMKERVRCGGLFSGFMLTSSSSSSSSSSYWVSSSVDDAVNNGKAGAVAVAHGRGRSWGWAFSSPMRAFSGKPSSSKENRRDIIRDANDKNATPNLSAIPSLLAVRS